MPSDPVETVVDACDAGGGKEQGDIVAWRRRKRVTVSVTWPRLVTESMGVTVAPRNAVLGEEQRQNLSLHSSQTTGTSYADIAISLCMLRV